MTFPREQKIVGRQNLKLVFDELLHPQYLIQLPLEFDVITHQQAHFPFSYHLQLLKRPLHDLIKLLLNFTALPIDLFEFGLSDTYQRHQTLLLFVQRRIDFLQEFGSFIIFLSNSYQIMHEHFPRTMVSLYFAIDAERSVTLKTKQLQFYCGVKKTVTNNFGLFGQLGSFVLVDQSILMVSLIARITQVRVLSLTINSGYIVFAELTSNFLAKNRGTSLNSLYLSQLIEKWTIQRGRMFSLERQIIYFCMNYLVTLFQSQMKRESNSLPINYGFQCRGIDQVMFFVGKMNVLPIATLQIITSQQSSFSLASFSSSRCPQVRFMISWKPFSQMEVKSSGDLSCDSLTIKSSMTLSSCLLMNLPSLTEFTRQKEFYQSNRPCAAGLIHSRMTAEDGIQSSPTRCLPQKFIDICSVRSVYGRSSFCCLPPTFKLQSTIPSFKNISLIQNIYPFQSTVYKVKSKNHVLCSELWQHLLLFLPSSVLNEISQILVLKVKHGEVEAKILLIPGKNGFLKQLSAQVVEYLNNFEVGAPTDHPLQSL